MKVYSRKRWGARSPRTLSTDGKKTELFIHYSAGQGRSIESFAEQSATMKSIQNYHMDSNGWSDIGYHYVVFQPYGTLRLARLFKGRYRWAVPAAQGGHNSGTIAVCVVMKDGEPLKRATRRLLKDLKRLLEAAHGDLDVRGHYEVTPTSCPGTALRDFLPELRRA